MKPKISGLYIRPDLDVEPKDLKNKMLFGKSSPWKLPTQNPEETFGTDYSSCVDRDTWEEEAVMNFLPVPLQGHQEPGEQAAHSPGSWRWGLLPCAWAGAQHPAGSRGTAGWLPRAAPCCRCKPADHKATPWRESGGTSLSFSTWVMKKTTIPLH